MRYNEIARLSKILSDSNRLEILDILSCGERCACDILEHFNFSQPTLSHHMKVLVDEKLVIKRRAGNRFYYKLNHQFFDIYIQQLIQINTANEGCICEAVTKGACKP